ncbi:YoaK family protein [Herbaspirillum autotrophicum]|uniref:YoaK family protein n=1 Tax=Herbaspirillum autotrophicum TaxID=180195 RepID=UPI00067DFAFE|nr:YoaK family protein [Herbaspirillum autotrophicum]
MSISATTASRKLPAMPTLKAFIAGFVDTVGFVALFGLFTAHVTGNFVLIGASVANGRPGVIGKLLALPTFIIGVALTRLLILALLRKQRDAAVPLMAVELIALLLFMAAGVYYAPFADANSWIAIGVGMLGVLTMSVQNAGSRTTFLHLGPTTVMTGNVTQIVIDLVDLMTGVAAPETRERIGKTWPPVAGFAIGAVGGGLCYWLAGFWSLLVPAVALGFLLLRLCAAGR